MIWFTLLKRFWFLIPVFGIGIYVVILHHERDAARAQVLQLQDNLAAIRSANRSAMERAEHDKANADAAYRSSSDAAVLLGRALSDGVRRYEGRVRPDPVPTPGQPPEAARVDPIPEALAAALDACARDANRLQNAVDWATELTRGNAQAAHP